MRWSPALAVIVTTGALAACGAPSSSYVGAGGPPSASLAGQPAVPGSAFTATVDRVVDGDTFLARRDGRDLRVRLIGVNAPESVKPNSPVECFGPEASDALHRLLPPGARVRAAYEEGGQRDQYGRELWDVWLPDGRFLQGVLVAQGFVDARLYRPQDDYADLLAGLEDRARSARTGLWGSCR